MTDVAAPPIETGTAPEKLRCLNPADGSLVAEYPIAGEGEVAAAVARARAAAPDWEALGAEGRERQLLRWAAYLVAHADELADLVHAENGKPHDDAYLELVLALELIRWSAKNAGRELKSRTVKPGLLMANFAARVEYRPLGVVGVIGPWNYPLYTPAGSGAFALAAGNTVVFKPSEYTTAIGVYFAEAFAKANPDAPAGVLNVVTGLGATGAALCRADVDKIAFTGSTATGKKIMAACAERLTPVLLECGGKDALVVAEDADVRAAAKAAAWGGVSNSGQTCVGVERVYVVEPVRDEFLTALRKELDGIKAGAANDADYGPMTMPSQVDVVRRHVADAIEHGGTALIGGLNSIRAPFIDPIVLVDTDESSAAVQEETFGPTLTVRTVRDVDEAVTLANGTRYGLASTVFSRHHGVEIARRLRAGATSINAPLGFGAIPSLPFGGVGESGIGRIHGAEGLREFVRPHSIARQRYAIPGMSMLTFDRRPSLVRTVKKVVARRHGTR
jgi:acyl-CoA reductase-like NAD-dependent aldehyde dehydrogenase